MIGTEDVLGYGVVNTGGTAIVDSIIDWITSGKKCRWLACLNPHSYAVALQDPKSTTALKNADWLIPDGIGIVLASRILGGVIKDRVTGPDIFLSLHQRMNAAGGMSVFFLGATEGTLRLISNRMAKDYPQIYVAGTYSPPFRFIFSQEEIDDMIAAINAAAPDVLWVGMTAPRQEKWIYENNSGLNVKFVGAIGAMFDFYARKVRRSPVIFQKLGLEWLPRLLQQPRRLWRRMGVSAPIFLWHVLRQRFFR